MSGYINIDSEYKNYFYAENDICDDRGILLLRKGQLITDDIREKLSKHGIKNVKASDRGQQSISQIHSKVIDSVTRNLEERLKVQDKGLFEKANLILKSVIFENKSKPWWVCINALANYLGWLYTHSIDVGLISLVIAARLGYSDQELFNIGLSALLHDVGKLLVPKAILQKPGSLSEIEQNIVRQHCDLGASSLQGFNLPKEYIDVVMQHHERLDGSGYPRGLKGNDICLNVRIVIVADVADKMTSYCPHEKLQDMECAMRRIKSQNEKYPQDLVLMLEELLLA